VFLKIKSQGLALSYMTALKIDLNYDHVSHNLDVSWIYL
jgi:hypothetical protein